MTDRTGLPFERELRIARATTSGLVAYVDGSCEPSIAWSDEFALRDWVRHELRSAPVPSGVPDREVTADQIADRLRDNDATGEVVELKPSSTLNVAERFGFRRNK